jgi:hypothetical protein
MNERGALDGEQSAGAVDACSCKVGRNVRRYDLAELDAELRRRHADGASLRELEAVVNRSVLRSALRTAGVDVVGDVAAVDEALTDDEVSAGRRTETRERLAQEGIDVDALEDDFASYQTVRTHLRECLDVDTDRSKGATVEDARGTIEWTRSRSEAITGRTIDRLRDADELSVGDPELTLLVRVTCSDCETTYPVTELLDRGGCDCSDDAS